MSDGYGYSVWYVPTNYKELKEHYNMKHIPHVTLETNLLLRDAYHIYHNSCSKITAEFHPEYVHPFPSLYAHDPMVASGWYVRVLQMTGRKLNWTPHMSVSYVPRGQHDNMDFTPSWRPKPPSGKTEYFLVIADTRSGDPTDWHIDNVYFNLKGASSHTLMHGLTVKETKKVARSFDTYFGSCINDIPQLGTIIRGLIQANGKHDICDADLMQLCSEVEKELVARSLESMEIDKQAR